MATKLKSGILYKLPYKTEEEIEQFKTALKNRGFFFEKNSDKYFIQRWDDVWYLDYVDDNSVVDTDNNTVTYSFNPVNILNECQELENITQCDIQARAYTFVGEYTPYNNVFGDQAAIETSF